jgi:hypothetical protein
MPDSFAAFFSSTMIFDLYAAAGAPDEVPQHLRDDPRSAFPLDFVEHITTVTESLKARIEDLHAQYTPRLRVPGHQPEGQTQGSSSADSDQSRHIQISN